MGVINLDSLHHARTVGSGGRGEKSKRVKTNRRWQAPVANAAAPPATAAHSLRYSTALIDAEGKGKWLNVTYRLLYSLHTHFDIEDCGGTGEGNADCELVLKKLVVDDVPKTL